MHRVEILGRVDTNQEHLPQLPDLEVDVTHQTWGLQQEWSATNTGVELEDHAYNTKTGDKIHRIYESPTPKAALWHEIIYALGPSRSWAWSKEAYTWQDNVQEPLPTKVLHCLGPSGRASPHRRHLSDLPFQGRGQRVQRVNHLHRVAVYSILSLI